MVGESNQNVFDSDRLFEIRRIRDIRVRDIESRLYLGNVIMENIKMLH